MKVYVVTNGGFSDYHIVRIFADKDKAETYQEFHACKRVEEWEVSDGEVETVTPIWTICASYEVHENEINVSCDKECAETIDRSVFIKYQLYRSWAYNKLYHKIYIKFKIPRKMYEEENCVKSKYKDKLLKIAQDYWGLISAQLADGATVDDINQMLSGKSDEIKLETNE